MARFLELNDFRSRRRVLDPDDFALGSDVPDPDPTDLIDQETWNEVQTLPSDVSIRTTSYQGGAIRRMTQLKSLLLPLLEDQTAGPVLGALLDSYDELDAAIFACVHGYYRQALAGLRSSLEIMTIGASLADARKITEYKAWQAGELELSFGGACNTLMGIHVNKLVVSHFRSSRGNGVIDQKDPSCNYDGGWIRQLYVLLCKPTHLTPGFANGNYWQSNGPIYDEASVTIVENSFSEIVAAMFVLLGFAGKPVEIPPQVLASCGSNSWAEWAPEVQKMLGGKYGAKQAALD